MEMTPELSDLLDAMSVTANEPSREGMFSDIVLRTWDVQCNCLQALLKEEK